MISRGQKEGPAQSGAGISDFMTWLRSCVLRAPRDAVPARQEKAGNFSRRLDGEDFARKGVFSPARSQTCARNEPRQVATTLRLVTSHGAAGVVLATAPVASPQAYSRMVRARICFALVCARAEALRGVSSLDLAEKANTFSALLGALIQIVVAIFGAFSPRIFNVSPSSTIRDAVPSVVKLWGPLCPTL